jgi:structural maintenance of chromosome 1
VMWSYLCAIYHSKASASVLAVDETHKTLTREEKTASRTLAQLSEKEQGFDEKKTTRTEELHQLKAKREEVGLFVSTLILHNKNECFFK